MPRIVNPANAVTAARYLILPPFVYYVDRGEPQLAMVALVVCGLFDKLDGLVAKLFDCKSELGAIFDAITDALCYGFCLVVVAAYGLAPPLAVILIIALGIYNIGARVLYGRRVQTATNFRSIAMERVVAFAAFLIGFALADYQVQYFFWSYTAVTAAVLAHDTKRMLFDPVADPSPS